MIIIADEMENAMNYDSVEFFLELGSILDSIFTDTIDADEKITGKSVALAIIESDDISEIVMLEILLVYIKNVIVGTEDDGNVSDATDLAFCDKSEPAVSKSLSLKDKVCILKKI